MKVGLAAFFTFMTVTEGGGRRAVSRKFQEVYLPALKANFMLWPTVQILNFRVIPLPLQIVSAPYYLWIHTTDDWHSPSSLPLGSPGLHTYPSPTPLMRSQYPFLPIEHFI